MRPADALAVLVLAGLHAGATHSATGPGQDPAGDGSAATPPAAPASTLLQAAVQAHGGQTLLRLDTLTAEWQMSHALIGEDREPGPPWDRARAWTGTALDLAHGRLAERSVESGAGYQSDVAVQAGADGAEIADLRAGTRRRHRDRTTGHAGASARQRLPALLVRLAAVEPDRWRPAGEGRCLEQPTHAAAFDDPGGETWTLHLEETTHRAVCLDYSFHTYEGERVPVTITYGQWRVVDGIPLPHDLTYQGPGVDSHATLLHAGANADLAPYFQPFDLPLEETPEPPEFGVDTLGDRVWVIGEGVFRQLFVEVGDTVVAYDGLGGDVHRRLETLAELTGGKPVSHVVLSHPHADHHGGLAALAARGAQVVAVPAHWPAVRRLTGLADEQWLPMEEEWRLERGGVEVIATDLGPTPHAEHLVGLWLPHARVLAQSDLFVRRHGAVRAADPNRRALAAAIARHGWQPRWIQDGHSPYLATYADLRTSLAKDPVARAGAWQSMPDLTDTRHPALQRHR